MDLPERVLHDARRLQQELIQWRILALGLGLDRLPAEIVNRSAKAGHDLLACDVESLGNHLYV
jgi:hypothetical protein